MRRKSVVIIGSRIDERDERPQWICHALIRRREENEVSAVRVVKASKTGSEKMSTRRQVSLQCSRGGTGQKP